jgi:hypothetical protein
MTKKDGPKIYVRDRGQKGQCDGCDYSLSIDTNVSCRSPTTAPSLAKLHKQFYSAKLKKKVNPNIFITYLKHIRTRMEEMESKMSDDQFMLHILKNLSRDYENQINKVEDRLGHSTETLDIEELRDELCLRYERLNTKEESDDSEDEKTLFGAQFKSL